jgi:isoleucyl-tRNA synthetase
MPSAQHHFPFENEERFKASFPADFICEAIDQTRGWFYSLLAINALVFDSTPYKNVVCLNLILDAEGQKMSKTKGNVIDPWVVFDGAGADALRWYFFSGSSPWNPRSVSLDGIVEAKRKTLLTLWNVFSFFATYADLDGWEPPAATAPSSHPLDRWVASELDDTIAAVTAALDGFDALAAATRLARFIDDLSNWYVRRSRPRFWKSADAAAHATLHRCLVVTAQLLAPFCPFLADELYTSLTGETSVHLADWPIPAGVADPELSRRVEAARRLVALGRAGRSDARVKTRQPLRRALLLHPGVVLDDAAREEIKGELNVKTLEDVDTLSGLMTWQVLPNFRVLGPRLGPRVTEVKAALAAADGSALQRALDEQGWIEVAGERLTRDEVDVRATRHESFALAEEAGWAVAIDLELDDDLRREGIARELVRSIHDLRKDQGLAISDRIRVQMAGGDAVRAAFDSHREWIAGEILAVELAWAGGGDLTIDIAGEAVAVSLTRTT